MGEFFCAPGAPWDKCSPRAHKKNRQCVASKGAMPLLKFPTAKTLICLEILLRPETSASLQFWQAANFNALLMSTGFQCL